MKKFSALVFILVVLLSVSTVAQTNIISTNAVAQQILTGNYNPASYAATNVINSHDSIAKGINAAVSRDSLRSYLDILSTFQNRNTASDTVSNTTGIGAARRWVYDKLGQFSASNEHRLVVSYLQFDTMICTVRQHRNIFAVLPGSDTTDKSVIIIEGHLDSRCKDNCDTTCLAQGMEDNGSGTALVLELARVMSRFSFTRSILFLCTIGEEQGLFGANAFALYCQQQGIAVKGVMNNDIVGGVLCGHTSSAPSCPGFGNIDSTHVRLFSFPGFNSFPKQLARFIKLQYKEELFPFVSVPMELMILTGEDRTGRGGDHIPFRGYGYAAMRFTSANESGNANTTDTSYHDRQHTSDDILGEDTNFDSVIDSFFVDFGYLARNTAINGVAAGMMGIGPKTPDFTVSGAGGNNLTVQITDPNQYLKYRIGVRTATNDWDSVYSFSGTLVDTFQVSPAQTYDVSVASVDNSGVESLFSKELLVRLTDVNELKKNENEIVLLQNNPNPLDESTVITVYVANPKSYRQAFIVVTDSGGKEVKRMEVKLIKQLNETTFNFGNQLSGTYFYSLILDGKIVDTKKMILGK